jgi:hypothetical protein
MIASKSILFWGSLAILLGSLSLPFADDILRWTRALPSPRLDNRETTNPFVFGRCGRVRPSHLSLFADASARSECAYRAGPQFVLSSEFFPGPFGDVPLMVNRHPNYSLRNARLAIVSVIGGPSESIFYNDSDIRTNEFLKLTAGYGNQGVVMLTPAYLGTSVRTLYPSPSFDPAVEELGSLISLVRSTAPDTPICVIGASLGGYLAARVSRRFANVPVLAINPLITTPAAYSRAYRSNVGARADVFGREVRLYRLQPRAVFLRSGIEPITAMGEAFYGNEFGHSLRDQLSTSRAPFHIVYSAHDDRIGVSGIRAVSMLPNVRVTRVESAAHDISFVDDFRPFRRVLDEFIQRCARQNDRRPGPSTQ